MIQHIYQVAGHRFALSYEQSLDQLFAPMLKMAYLPFEVKEDEKKKGSLLFSMTIENNSYSLPADYQEEARQEEEGQVIQSGVIASEGKKVFIYQWGDVKNSHDAKEDAIVVASPDYQEATLYVNMDASYAKASFDSSMMMLYALASATHDTLLFHASTIVWRKKAYLFLGTSGTGKSTHTSLWLKHIRGAHLLNDDNPVVRISPEGKPMVCGSPWSGKTPCYKNETYPIGGLVKLRQYPKNQIRPLSTLEAYSVILSSVSGKRWEEKVHDGLHATTEAIIKGSKLYQLDCLPDEAAARLSWQTLTGGDPIYDMERLIEEGRSVIFPVKGNSMLPFIIGGSDKVEFHPIKDTIRLGDVVMAWVKEGYPVVHRVVGIGNPTKLNPTKESDRQENTWLLLSGDGNLGFVEHCRLNDIIARGEFVVDLQGNRKPLRSDKALRRWRMWRNLRPVRRPLLKLFKISKGIK